VDEVLRLAAALGLVGSLAGIGVTARFAVRRLVSRHRGARIDDLAERLGLPAGTPSIIYVWSERCAQCVQLQEPALARLAKERGIYVRKLHPREAPEVVRRFSILTVPSPIVVDRERRVRAVNLGFADAEALAAQLA